MNLPEDILFYAFRYALGRMTYAVNEVATEIIRHADKLHENIKGLMIREIEEAIAKGQAGMAMDVNRWEEVLDALKK